MRNDFRTRLRWRARRQWDDGTWDAKVERLAFGDYSLSCQAGETSYCKPVEYLADFREYRAFELALFRNKKWVNPHEHWIFRTCPWLEHYWEDRAKGVGSYVPAEKVQQLVNVLDLIAKHGETEDIAVMARLMWK